MDDWECGCGRTNPGKAGNCLLCRTPKGQESPPVPTEQDNPEYYFRTRMYELMHRLDGEGLAYVGPTYLRHPEHYTHAQVDELLRDVERTSREHGEEEGFQYLRPSVVRAAAGRPVSLSGWLDRPRPDAEIDPVQYFETRWNVLSAKLEDWGFAGFTRPQLYNLKSLTCAQVDSALAAYEEAFLQARRRKAG